MQAKVTLPAGPLIEYHSLCKAIAEATYPVRQQGFEGIECVVGKMSKPRPQDVSADTDATDRAVPGQALLAKAALPSIWQEVGAFQEGRELAFPYALDETDRIVLEGLLPKLPPLRYPIAEGEAAAFMQAYSELPNRPAWEPILMTEADVIQQDRLQEQHFDNVLQALRDEFAAGRLIACTQTGLPVKAMTLRCFVPRQSAIDYLHRYGLAHDGDAPDVTVPQDSPEPQGAIRRKLTNKQKQELVAYWKALDKDNAKAPTQQTAKKYDVSDGYVRRLLRKAEDMPPTNMFPA